MNNIKPGPMRRCLGGTRLGSPWLGNVLRAGAAGLAALLLAGNALAQDWPKQPVKIVLAIAPGSSGDTLARMLAPHLQEMWKQPVVIENRPGAGGIVGTGAVANATDGHTLLFGTQSSILPKYTQKSLSFDPLVDLVPVYKFINYEAILATNAETARQAKTLAELVALSKANGQGIFLAGSGPTSIFNISVGILNQQLGIKYTAVNFNNIGAMNIALMRDDAQLVMNAPSSIRAHIDSGAIVPLAAISAERYASLPKVPTLKEATGYRGYLPQLWHGFFVPRGTPAAVVERISRDVRTLANNAELRSQIEAKLSGSVVKASTPAGYAKEIQEETTVWKDLFKAINFQPE